MLGTDDVLPPGGLSEPIEIRLKTSRETGLDAALDFRVMGRVPRAR